MTVDEIGKIIRKARKTQSITQSKLAMTANTAPRFISNLENGKPTCEIGKALHVLQCLGISIEMKEPA